jgi:hypothetical protein
VVEESDAHSTAWVDTLVAIPLRFHDSERSIRELFVSARPDLSDRNRFVTTVAERLRAEPTLIDAWQQFSYDNRGTPSPISLEWRWGSTTGAVETWLVTLSAQTPVPTSSSARLSSCLGQANSAMRDSTEPLSEGDL